MAKRKAKRKKAKKTIILIRRLGSSWEIVVQASEVEITDWLIPPLLIGNSYYINRDAAEADAARWSKVLRLPVVTEEK